VRAFLLLIALLLPAIAAAQDLSPVQCRFLCFGGTDDSATVLAISEKGDEITCPLSSSSISAPIDCVAKGGKIIFLSPDDRKPAATATIPAAAKSVLLVFVKAQPKPGSATSLPWRVLVVDDSPKAFPDGGAYIANFHARDIRFVIGEHKGMLRPAGAHGYARPATRDAFNMAPVMFQFLHQDQWRTANESALRFVPGIRYLIFAFTDPASGRPRIRTYQDSTRTTVSN
jgi:hypothetical protein